MSRTRRLLLVAIAILLAALFVRLGIWQLGRHAERSERNDLRERRAALPALDLTASSLPGADSARWRRARLDGRYDAGREIVLRARGHEGIPGVELLTPLRLGSGEDAPAVLVLRGWLPAPDGLRADLADGWPTPEPDTTIRATAEGIVETAWAERSARPLRIPYDGREHAVLVAPDLEAAREILPYAVAPFWVRATDPGPTGEPLRPPRPAETGAGPHLPYAIQWFSFAAIALVGTTIYLHREGRS